MDAAFEEWGSCPFGASCSGVGSSFSLQGALGDTAGDASKPKGESAGEVRGADVRKGSHPPRTPHAPPGDVRKGSGEDVCHATAVVFSGGRTRPALVGPRDTNPLLGTTECGIA